MAVGGRTQSQVKSRFRIGSAGWVLGAAVAGLLGVASVAGTAGAGSALPKHPVNAGVTSSVDAGVTNPDNELAAPFVSDTTTTEAAAVSVAAAHASPAPAATDVV